MRTVRRMRGASARVKLVACLGATGIALVGALFATPATPAQAADIGDGLLACSVGEICLKKHRDSNWTDDLKHFWNEERNHDYVEWSGPEEGIVGENASMYWSRDTECLVYILDYKPIIGLYDFGLLPRGHADWYAYYDDWNDRNDGHSRCTT